MIPEKQKILIVDDSEMNRAILTGILDDGYDFLEAENGLQALDVLRAHRDISLVLLDIVMPELDGFGVLSVMGEQHWIDQTPVIMISAESDSMLVERAYQLGATDYISRPFDKSVVRRRVINTLMLYGKQKHLMRMITEQVYRREKSNRLMTGILSHIVEFRNAESGPHVQHIQTVSELLLRQLARKTDRYPLTEDDIALISTASALHDIGKISIPDSILNKPGKLTAEEFEVVKTHAAVGASILQNLPMTQDEPLIQVAYQICRWHHERYDGHGYPDGLVGDQIPITAQVVSLADVYDALTGERCYKKAYPHETAVRMIQNGECGVFNPLLIECLLDIQDQLQREIGTPPEARNFSLAAQRISDHMVREDDLPFENNLQYRLAYEREKQDVLRPVCGRPPIRLQYPAGQGLRQRLYRRPRLRKPDVHGGCAASPLRRLARGQQPPAGRGQADHARIARRFHLGDGHRARRKNALPNRHSNAVVARVDPQDDRRGRLRRPHRHGSFRRPGAQSPHEQHHRPAGADDPTGIAALF